MLTMQLNLNAELIHKSQPINKRNINHLEYLEMLFVNANFFEGHFGGCGAMDGESSRE